MVWFIGLFGFGKLLVVMLVEWKLFEKGIFVYVLDGDNLWYGFNVDLGFFMVDCVENLCWLLYVVILFVDCGYLVLVLVISFFVEYCVLVCKVYVDVGIDFFEVFCDILL